MSSLAVADGILRGSNPSAAAASFRCQIVEPLFFPPHRPLFSQPCRGRDFRARRRCVSYAASRPPSPAPTAASGLSTPGGLYASNTYELTAENVNLILDDVRPYLIADGGDVDVVSVEDGIISLKLRGACGTCPSSTTTMKMGIERVLKEKFGEAIKDIRQVAEYLQFETTVEAINNHLEILRPAIKNYGGTVQVVSVDGGNCHVKYVGPESIGSGIKAAIKERFPDITNVVFID